MIIFLYGSDTYRSKQKLEEIIERYKEVHKSGLNLRFFNGKELNHQDFEDEFQQTPMFQEKKLIILKNIFQNQNLKDYFIKDGKKFINSKDIIIFYEEGDATAKDVFFKFLIKNAKSQEFQPLDGVKLKNWAKKELDKYGAEIQPEALRQLIGCVGNDLWRFSNEIQKLAAFNAHKRDKMIETGDINLLIKPRFETDIFKTIEALALRDKKQALFLVHEHLERGDHPLYLLSMIHFQFRNLLVIKKIGKLNSHPFFVRKMTSLAESFTFEGLENIYLKIFETDLKIKTGQLDPQTGLDLLIAGI